MSLEESNSIKGELETWMETVISTVPIELVDHNEVKLNRTYDKKAMYKSFFEKYIKAFTFSSKEDEYRPPFANGYYGGIDFSSTETTGMIRGTGWELIKAIGKKILSGDFNLTTVSIPIKVMLPITILQHVCNTHNNLPIFLNIAAQQESALERFKYVIIGCMSSWYRSNLFLKPLNPILGETYEVIWEDGSHEYVEQTSHHPPVSRFIMYGPEENFKYYGYLNFISNAWVNSFKLINTGNRTAEFKNSKIHFNYNVDQYCNTFWGVIRLECIGEMKFVDSVNGISTTFTIGKDKTICNDYFEGEIINDKDGTVLSKFKGSYLSNINFDGKRYWDIRENPNIEQFPVKNQLKSSSIYREDSNMLYRRNIEEAQNLKEKLENIQRADRKLRAKFKETE